MKDFVSGRENELVHIANQAINVALADLVLGIIPNKHPAVLQALDVLAGDANVHDVEVFATGLAGQVAGFGDGANGLLDVGDDAAHDSLRFDLSGPSSAAMI